MGGVVLGTAAAAGAAGAGATAATAATSGLFGIGGAFSAMQTLSTIGTVFSLMNTLRSGSAEYQDYNTQADWERAKQANERVSDAQRRISVRERLARVNAQNFATYAARGIQLEGSPMSVTEESERQAARELDISRYNADQTIESSKGQESSYKSRGYAARASSKSRAAGAAFGLGAKLYDRGVI
jgi:hypothetical protein